MVRLLDVIASFSVGTLVGTELTVSLFVNPVLWRLEERAQAIGIRKFAERWGGVMPYWYGFNLLLLLAEAIVRRDSPIGTCFMPRLLYGRLRFCSRLIFLVPINNRLASRTEYRLDALTQQHRLWDDRHRVRILAVGCAFVCLLLSVIH
jgi:hypothetical protein